MRSRFITDPQDTFDSFDSFLDSAGAGIYTSFLPSAGNGGGNLSASTRVDIPATPALTSEAVQAESAQSGTSTLVPATSGGITINLLFDAAAMAAPPIVRPPIQQAASIFPLATSLTITVTLTTQYTR